MSPDGVGGARVRGETRVSSAEWPQTGSKLGRPRSPQRLSERTYALTLAHATAYTHTHARTHALYSTHRSSASAFFFARAFFARGRLWWCGRMLEASLRGS